LLTLFLYPYISLKTLLEIEDKSIFILIQLYLKSVCTEIVANSFFDSLVCDVDEKGFILDSVFHWPQEFVSSNTIVFDENKIRRYLRTNLNWDWIDHARITPIYNENTIEVENYSSPQNKCHIFINKSKKKAVLMMNDKIEQEFIVTSYKLYLSIDKRTSDKKIDFFINYLIEVCKKHKTIFLQGLLTQIKPNDKVYKVLLKDNNFVEALEQIQKMSRLI
jgi:hypothetical protein